MSDPKPAPNPPGQTPPVTPPGTPQPKPPATPPDQPGQPQPGKPIGDPPGTDKPKIAQAPVVIGKPQVTLEPGENGGSEGSVHTEPLVKNSPQRKSFGPGTYGNDQFNAEHHDDFIHDRELPEGLCNAQEYARGEALRPTAKPKEQRYGRIGGEGKG